MKDNKLKQQQNEEDIEIKEKEINKLQEQNGKMKEQLKTLSEKITDLHTNTDNQINQFNRQNNIKINETMERTVPNEVNFELKKLGSESTKPVEVFDILQIEPLDPGVDTSNYQYKWSRIKDNGTKEDIQNPEMFYKITDDDINSKISVAVIPKNIDNIYGEFDSEAIFTYLTEKVSDLDLKNTQNKENTIIRDKFYLVNMYKYTETKFGTNNLEIGDTLKVYDNNKIVDNPNVTFTWYVGDEEIDNETNSYRINPADVGKHIRVSVIEDEKEYISMTVGKVKNEFEIVNLVLPGQDKKANMQKIEPMDTLQIKRNNTNPYEVKFKWIIDSKQTKEGKFGDTLNNKLNETYTVVKKDKGKTIKVQILTNPQIVLETVKVS